MKNFFLAIFLLFSMTRLSFGDNIKEPNVSGQFYPADAGELSRDIDAYLNSAQASPSEKNVGIIIAPHAGYVYSGGVAAYSFKAASRKACKTIVILAPSHFYPFNGVSVWDEGGFRTPLGVVDVDREFARGVIEADSKFYFDPQAFAQEHSLEVEIPFLQKVFKDFKIVPIVMGQPTLKLCEHLAATLNRLIGTRDDVLVVVSSDMSHYHDAETARAMDHATLGVIKDLDVDRFWTNCQQRKMEMCGFVPVATAMLLAKQRGLINVDILRYAHSGDVSGDNDRVVGYGSVIFSSNAPAKNPPAEKEDGDRARKGTNVAPLTGTQKKRLIDIARQTVQTFVRTGKVSEFKETDPRLLETEGAFVTIHKNGDLRGCIGNIVSDSPLFATVRDMAVAAASSDPRFSPVTPDELPDLDIEISVLSRPWPVTDVEEIQPGVHGVIVQQGRHHGVFLPQVAPEWGWDREELLTNLCAHKAGLPADAWKDPKTHLEIFTADVFSEKDVE